MRIGNIIKRIIKEQGLTQEDLGFLSLKKTGGAVSQFCKNKNTGIENVLQLLEPVGYGLVVCDIETYMPKYRVTLSSDQAHDDDPALPWSEPPKKVIKQRDIVGHNGRVTKEEEFKIRQYKSQIWLKDMELREKELAYYKKIYKSIGIEISNMENEIKAQKIGGFSTNSTNK